jgi:hypothetical protein
MLMASKPLLAKKNVQSKSVCTEHILLRPLPNLLLHSSDTILTTTREVTLIKKTYNFEIK